MRWTDRLAQLCVCAGVVMLPLAANAATGNDYAMYAVANRELLDLALSGQSGL